MQLFKKRGEITVFLSLILSVTLGFICIVFESVRSQSIKFQMETAMDSALRSCFGEYHRELFKKYHLLYIDSSYRVSSAEICNTEDHLHEYFQENLDFPEGESTDYFSMDVTETEAESYLLASDDKGLPVYFQACEYLRNYGDTSHAASINGIRSNLYKNDADGILSAWDESLSRVNSFGVAFVNPAEIVRSMASNADSQIIRARKGKLSKIPYNDIPSKRNLNKGNYQNIPEKENVLIFSEYLYQNCGSFVKPKTDSALSCEQEYLIYGYMSDEANLKAVINRLLRIFSEKTLEYTKQREDECHLYAEIIVPFPKNPEDPLEWFDREALVNAVSDSLTYAWAFAEAVLKIDRLIGGGRVNAVNPSDEWIVPLMEITLYRAMLGGSGGSGYCYEEFLSAFQKNIGRETLCMRFLDLIEINMRNLGSPGFMADGCIEYMKIKVGIRSLFGYEYNITRDYAYEDKYRKENNS